MTTPIATPKAKKTSSTMAIMSAVTLIAALTVGRPDDGAEPDAGQPPDPAGGHVRRPAGQ